MNIDAMIEFVWLPYIQTKLLVLYCSPDTPSCSIGGAALTRLGIGINDSVLSQYFAKDTVAELLLIVLNMMNPQDGIPPSACYRYQFIGVSVKSNIDASLVKLTWFVYFLGWFHLNCILFCHYHLCVFFHHLCVFFHLILNIRIYKSKCNYVYIIYIPLLGGY